MSKKPTEMSKKTKNWRNSSRKEIGSQEAGS
jgi:hypothetical protein